MSTGIDLGFPGDGAVERVLISSLRCADSPRLVAEDPEHVQVLAQSESAFPPIVVHRPTMRVVDGVHRIRVALLRGADRIDARFVEGAEKDIFLLAVRLNAAHGLPLSLADRRAATVRVLTSHPEMSDRAIAMAMGLAATTVRRLRLSTANAASPDSVRIGRDGKRRPLNIADGRRVAGELVRENPGTPLRQIAKQAGISLGTAADVRNRILRGEDPVPRPRQDAEMPSPRPSNEVAAGPTPMVLSGNRYPAPDTVTVMRALLVDPSLRFNDFGRGLLRWLGSHMVDLGEWHAHVDSVPSHCARTVADLARECSDSWREFAERLERRGGPA